MGERTFWRPIGVLHTVNAGEVSSGIANVAIIPTVVTATPEMAIIVQAFSSANAPRTITAAKYVKASGVVTVTATFVAGDTIDIIGMLV